MIGKWVEVKFGSGVWYGWVLGCGVRVNKNLIFSFKLRRGLQRQSLCRQNSAQC